MESTFENVCLRRHSHTSAYDIKKKKEKKRKIYQGIRVRACGQSGADDFAVAAIELHFAVGARLQRSLALYVKNCM